MRFESTAGRSDPREQIHRRVSDCAKVRTSGVVDGGAGQSVKLQELDPVTLPTRTDHGDGSDGGRPDAGQSDLIVVVRGNPAADLDEIRVRGVPHDADDAPSVGVVDLETHVDDIRRAGLPSSRQVVAVCVRQRRCRR